MPKALCVIILLFVWLQEQRNEQSRQVQYQERQIQLQTDCRYQQTVLSELSLSPNTNSVMVQNSRSPHPSSRTSESKMTHQPNQLLPLTSTSHSAPLANRRTSQQHISPSSSRGNGPPTAPQSRQSSFPPTATTPPISKMPANAVEVSDNDSTLSTVTNRSAIIIPPMRIHDNVSGSRANGEMPWKKRDQTKHVKFVSKNSSPQWRDRRHKVSDAHTQHSLPGAQGAEHQKREEHNPVQNEHASSHLSAQQTPRYITLS